MRKLSDKLGFVLKNNNNKALLLFHGLTGSPLELKQYAKLIHKEGYDIYCPTLPGHGQYLQEIRSIKWQDCLNFSMNKYMEIKKEYEEVYVGGSCLGAVIALAIAAESSSVSGIVALSTTLFLDGWTIPWYKFLIPLALNTVFRYYYSFPEKAPYGIKNPKVREKMLLMMNKSTIALEYIPMTTIYELLSFSKYTRNNLEDITAPCFIIHSKLDDISSLKSARLIYKNISSKIKSLCILENSYHMLTMDNDKDLVAKKTIDFLNNISKTNNKNEGALSGKFS